MTRRRPTRDTTRPWRRWRDDRSGVAALEFALTAPVLITMLLGTIDLVNGIRVQTRLNAAAGQLADMIAGQTALTTGSANGPGGTLGDMCVAASYTMQPYSSASLSAYIESTTVNGSGSTGQDWTSDTACPASRPAGSFNETVLLTNIADSPRSMFTADGTPRSKGGVAVKGYTAISLQLTYVYKNVAPYILGSSVTFTATAVARPRANVAPTCTYPSGNATAPCPGVY